MQGRYGSQIQACAYSCLELLCELAPAQVLQSFLLAPSDHPKLLSLLHKWPTTVYSVSTLTEDVLTRCP